MHTFTFISLHLSKTEVCKDRPRHQCEAGYGMRRVFEPWLIWTECSYSRCQGVNPGESIIDCKKKKMLISGCAGQLLVRLIYGDPDKTWWFNRPPEFIHHWRNISSPNQYLFLSCDAVNQSKMFPTEIMAEISASFLKYSNDQQNSFVVLKVQNITYEKSTAMSVFWDGNSVTHDNLRCCEQFRLASYIESQKEHARAVWKMVYQLAYMLASYLHSDTQQKTVKHNCLQLHLLVYPEYLGLDVWKERQSKSEERFSI